MGKVTKSTPLGSLDVPFNPVSLALGAEASFVARTIDSDRKHLVDVLRAAAHHRGTALVEIYQNCNIFNDGAFDLLKAPETRDDSMIRLVHGEPIRFGADGDKGVVRMPDGTLQVVDVAEFGTKSLLVHDSAAPNPEVGFALSRLADPTSLDTTAIGVFRDVSRPTYDDLLHEQLTAAAQQQGAGDQSALQRMLLGGDTWTVD
jgi:2-oxoglutarate ferredoxin oxidoreductase subunit beta